MRRPDVGLLFNPALAEYVADHAGRFDRLAVIPDRCWIDRGIAASPRFEPLQGPIAIIDEAVRRAPVVLHAIGLSLASADLFDRGYVEQLARWRERLGCEWVSEHLSFSRIGAGHEANAALALASPYDHELLELIVPRVREVQATLGVPLLLENAVAYVRYDDEDLSEPAFLNALVAETGCGLLLDLHNLYTNAHNHHFDALDYLAAIDLAAVLELHVAGGDETMGMHTDSHAGPVLAAVWPLLDAVLPRVPQLRAVTFEFHESSWPLLHADGVSAQLDRMRDAIARAAAHAANGAAGVAA